MRKKEHLKVEGLEKIRKLKEKIHSPKLLIPRVKIRVNSEMEARSIFNGKDPANSYLAKDSEGGTQICTRNLIAILSDISVYKEVYPIIKSNLLLLNNMSPDEDKEALYDILEFTLSNTSLGLRLACAGEGSLRIRKLKEVREGIKN